MKIFRNTSEKRMELALEMLELLGTGERYLNVTTTSTSANVPQGLKDIVMSEAKAHLSELMELFASIYASYFSAKDLEEMVKFYKSRVGRKLTDIGGPLEINLSKAGIKWTSEMLSKAEEKYVKEYLRIKSEEGINPSDYIPPLDINHW